MNPMERSRECRPMDPGLRRHHFGPVQPMHQPSWLERLIEKVRA